MTGSSRLERREFPSEVVRRVEVDAVVRRCRSLLRGVEEEPLPEILGLSRCEMIKARPANRAEGPVEVVGVAGGETAAGNDFGDGGGGE